MKGRSLRAWRAAAALCAAALLATACSGNSAGPGAGSGSSHSATASTSPSASVSPSTSPSTVASPPLGVLGSYEVGQHWTTFTEPAHTGPTGEQIGPRRLLVQIRYPLDPHGSGRAPAAGPFPLLIFAPGFQQCGAPYGDMLRSWATAGYVVVVVNFPESDCVVGGAATESDMVNQPADVSYVITRMLALSAGNGLFSGLVDPRQIAITGQSDGGDTVAAIAANSCCSDRRVVAVAVLSGAEWPPMHGSYFTGRSVPMLFTQGSADTVNFPACSSDMYLADRSTRYYLDLFGASHTGPYWGTNGYERVLVRVTLEFFNRYVLGRPEALAAMRRAGDVAGLAALYSDGQGGLTTGYCDN